MPHGGLLRGDVDGKTLIDLSDMNVLLYHPAIESMPHFRHGIA
jgi:hypothetical protein